MAIETVITREMLAHFLELQHKKPTWLRSTQPPSTMKMVYS
ncbi:hypothetical protein [Metabacillus halosaccharovorans]